MINEAEKFKEDDEKVVKKIESKNKLENYCFQLRNTMLHDDKMKKALGEDSETLDKTTQETLDWLDETDERGCHVIWNRVVLITTMIVYTVAFWRNLHPQSFFSISFIVE